MATNNDIFGWLENELASIKSRQFHIFEPLAIAEQGYVKDGRSFAIGGEFGEFMRRFGYARFFTDQHDAPSMSIYPLRDFRRHFCDDGRVYVGFGFRGQQSVFFDENAVLNGETLKVYLVGKKTAREVGAGFSDWLREAYDWIKSRYSNRRWQEIKSGPKPFSDEELEIVEARRRFNWQLVGFDESGNALFLVKNNSKIALRYLTIGVRDKGGSILTGGAYLDVSNIGPGQELIVSKDCYKDKIPPSELEPFDFPDPLPEKRAGYWEFGRP